MRLTLRTLLAYLDGNLEPHDSQDIGKKIEESEFASKLVHLIRDCTRRLRLGAPPIVGRGLGADPNTVAEYLEYRLSDDRVPEFERICLESEIHLAEVASCHQILTLVLGEPAEIDAQARERLYGLAAHADAPPPESIAARTPSPAPSPAAIPPAPPVRRPKPEVPDYLRESRWRFWPVAALVLIAATLTFGGLFFFAPGLREQMVGLSGDAAEPLDQAQDQSPAAPTEKPGEPAAEPLPGENPAVDESPADQPQSSSAEVPHDNRREGAVVAPQKPTQVDPDAPSAPEPPLPGASEPIDADPAEDRPAEPLPEKPADPAPAPLPADMPRKGPPRTEAPPDNPPAADEAKDAAPREPAMAFGRYMSKLEVLLKFDPATGNWLRLPFNSPLKKGDRLLSLPAFRPMITLGSNISIQADGAAQFELVGWTEDEVPIVAVEFGRLLMLTVGKANNPIELEIDDHRPRLTFIDAESTLAVEVRRELPPGTDPQAGKSPLSAQVYATSGLIRLKEGDGAPVELQSPAQRSLVPTTVEQPPAAEFPAWVNSEEQSDFDRLATGPLEAYLSSAKPAGLQLRELADPQQTKKREVRTLAIRSLVYLGDCEPCVDAMNDSNERLFWPLAMQELQAAVARSPESAAGVRAALEAKRGAEEGAALFRILWGYSTTDLKGGADRELVEGLNSESLDVRVMSFLTLKNLTGATHGYGPDDRDIKRRAAYNAWKQHNFSKPLPRTGGSPAKKPAAKGN